MTFKPVGPSPRRRDHNPRFLTKTRYVNGLACQKWVWLAFNSPDRLPKADESVEYRLDEGRRVGELARLRFPTGILLAKESVVDNDERSRSFLDLRSPLFEAGFIHPNGTCYGRADVLLPVEEDEWDIVEVKSAGALKAGHLQDVAFQRYCYAGAGLNIRKCFLLHINTKYERSGEIDPDQLFKQVDVTEAVNELGPTVEPQITSLLDISNSEVCPEFGRGERFHEDEDGTHDDDAVWKKHPDSDIRDLYRGGKQTLQLLESGIFRIQDIPRTTVLKGRQTIQQAAHTTGKSHVDSKKIISFLAKLEYPLHFLDFETFGTAVPLFEGVRPYQQIPFQYSLHVVDGPGQEPTHHAFLSLEPKDPRRGLVGSLERDIGPGGQLVAYNQGFEKGRLAEIGAFLPDKEEWVNSINARFLDLWAPFREFAYYNPRQGGSASLKRVLPALTGRDYGGFEIANGGAASFAYLRVAFPPVDGEKPSPEEVERTRAGLERYCAQDTEGMVWIVDKLGELATRMSR